MTCTQEYAALQAEADAAVNRAVELQRALSEAEARAEQGEAAARGARQEVGRAQQEVGGFVCVWYRY